MEFYLGTHLDSWLQNTDIPLMVSNRRLSQRKSLPRAICNWVLDSGGFSELSLFNTWQTTPRQYVQRVRRYKEEIGNLQWAATQDWMCEPFITKKTGLSVAEHQDRTVTSYIELMTMYPEMDWLPVIQGFTKPQYLECIEKYATRHVDLTSLPIVGIGSVCRRQATEEAVDIFHTISNLGIALHGFGVKTSGVLKSSKYLASSDSMAWSAAARRLAEPFFDDCIGHINCANCLRYATYWREQVMININTSITIGQGRWKNGIGPVDAR